MCCVYSFEFLCVCESLKCDWKWKPKRHTSTHLERQRRRQKLPKTKNRFAIIVFRCFCFFCNKQINELTEAEHRIWIEHHIARTLIWLLFFVMEENTCLRISLKPWCAELNWTERSANCVSSHCISWFLRCLLFLSWLVLLPQPEVMLNFVHIHITSGNFNSKFTFFSTRTTDFTFHMMYANVWWFICVMCCLWSMWIAQHALDRGMLLTDRNLYGCQSFSCMHFVIVSETLFGVLQIHRQFEVSSMFNSSFFLSQRSSQRDFDLWIQNVDANFEISLWVDFVDLIYLQPRNSANHN